jgi:hypothetical protein
VFIPITFIEKTLQWFISSSNQFRITYTSRKSNTETCLNRNEFVGNTTIHTSNTSRLSANVVTLLEGTNSVSLLFLDKKRSNVLTVNVVMHFVDDIRASNSNCSAVG